MTLKSDFESVKICTGIRRERISPTLLSMVTPTTKTSLKAVNSSAIANRTTRLDLLDLNLMGTDRPAASDRKQMCPS